MNELTQNFISGIDILLREKYDIRIIAKYIFEFSLNYKIEDEKLEYVVDYIGGMDAAPEFELTKKELLEFIKHNLL